MQDGWVPLCDFLGVPCAKRGFSPRERQCLHATSRHDPAAHRLRLGSHSAVGDAVDVAVLRFDEGEEGLSRFRSFQDQMVCLSGCISKICKTSWARKNCRCLFKTFFGGLWDLLQRDD